MAREREGKELPGISTDFETTCMYASRPMRRHAQRIVSGRSISWAARIDHDSPAYQEAVERTIKALEDWDKNDPGSR